MVNIDELERLEKAATPGPWKASECRDCDGLHVTGHSGNWADDATYADRVFIDHARNVLPELLARLRLAEAVVEAVLVARIREGDCIWSQNLDDSIDAYRAAGG